MNDFMTPTVRAHGQRERYKVLAFMRIDGQWCLANLQELNNCEVLNSGHAACIASSTPINMKVCWGSKCRSTRIDFVMNEVVHPAETQRDTTLRMLFRPVIVCVCMDRYC